MMKYDLNTIMNYLYFEIIKISFLKNINTFFIWSKKIEEIWIQPG